MRKVAAIFAAILFSALGQAELHAQTETEAEAVATSLAVCKDEEAAGDDDQDELEPCEQYIDANVKDDADTLKWMLAQIEGRKAYANQVSLTYYRRDEIVPMDHRYLEFVHNHFRSYNEALSKIEYPRS